MTVDDTSTVDTMQAVCDTLHFFISGFSLQVPSFAAPSPADPVELSGLFFCKYFIFTTLKVLPTVHGRCSQLSSSICKTLDLKSIGPVLGKGFSHE